MTPKRVLAALLLGSLLAAHAHAAGLNARWTNCLSDGGLANRNFACNSNQSTDALEGSFVLPIAISGGTGFVATVEIATAGSTVPAWWELHNTGSCRAGSGVINPVLPLTAVNCVDYAQGGTVVTAFGTFNIGLPGPNDIRFTVLSAVPATNAQDLGPGPEYFGFTFIINHQKTVGLGACAGCSIAACINLKSMDFYTTSSPSVPVLTLTGPTVPGSDTATWQGGAGVPALPGGACAGATPTRNGTWGAVKSLYR